MPLKVVRGGWSCFARLLRLVRARRVLKTTTGRGSSAAVEITDPFLRVVVERAPGATFVLNGRLTFDAWARNREPVFIKLSAGSSLVIDGDFQIGGGTRIMLWPGANCYIGGRRHESGSGITERGLIMVRNRLKIGVDCIIAWDVYITDCDWHEVAGVSNTKPTEIGDHVWITPRSTILKGTKISDGCIVATGSIVHNQAFPEKSLIAGVPGKVVASNRSWSRDLVD